jgi:hypothetical protein
LKLKFAADLEPDFNDSTVQNASNSALTSGLTSILLWLKLKTRQGRNSWTENLFKIRQTEKSTAHENIDRQIVIGFGPRLTRVLITF